MFDTPIPLSALHHFAQQYDVALQNAAWCLGGRPWLLRAQRLLDDLRQPARLTCRAERDAQALLDLLRLEHVHDENRIEAACFAVIDPTSPNVENICLLSEALRDALHAAQAQQETETYHV
ncbi:hypothetical protein [Limimaricola litoreus]|uniref:Uncharacterized protein n=1 Tax=Limimaricola litoreus TaxID=2955316 RepID=A0A9X2JNT9_9RHOB|nr:hypothetical protein [Limimaricola litoreus]MCP1167355.1 hypothetical protein [Limimaricola litoreus]